MFSKHCCFKKISKNCNFYILHQIKFENKLLLVPKVGYKFLHLPSMRVRMMLKTQSIWYRHVKFSIDLFVISLFSIRWG